jgi:hypothetical protein
MGETIDRITTYAIKLDSSLNDQEALLLEVVAEAVDRAIIYMSREGSETPFPAHLERPMASACVRLFRNITTMTNSEEGAVTRVKDHGQEISFSETLQNYMASAEDSKLFDSMYELLNRYRLARVIED